MKDGVATPYRLELGDEAIETNCDACYDLFAAVEQAFEKSCVVPHTRPDGSIDTPGATREARVAAWMTLASYLVAKGASLGMKAEEELRRFFAIIDDALKDNEKRWAKEERQPRAWTKPSATPKAS